MKAEERMGGGGVGVEEEGREVMTVAERRGMGRDTSGPGGGGPGGGGGGGAPREPNGADG